MRWYIPTYLSAALLALFLAGCNLPALNTTGTGLQAAGSAYVFENIDARKWVRAECREILNAEITALKAAGKYEEARQLLRDSYPPLVTLGIIADAEEDGVGGVLAQVISVPGFRPNAEIGVDHLLLTINRRLGLSGDDALPFNAEASTREVVK